MSDEPPNEPEGPAPAEHLANQAVSVWRILLDSRATSSIDRGEVDMMFESLYHPAQLRTN